MQLIVWNSQGNKWDTLWTNFMTGLVPHVPATEDILGLLVESGRAPWSVDVVRMNNQYDYPTDKNATVNQTAAAQSALCQAIGATNKLAAYWFPWVQNPDDDGDGNPRCSLGGVTWRRSVRSVKVDRLIHGDIRRPIVRVYVYKPTAPSIDIVLLQLHLTATPNTARQELATVMGTITKIIPTSTPAFIVGDLNVDLQAGAFPVNAPWRILNTNQATQQSGGELDWGLLYDPKNQYNGAGVNQLLGFKTGANTSDHSVMLYNFALPP